MSEDITTNVEVFPIVVGIIVSIILIVIDLFLFTGIISTFGVIIGSACAGFLCKNSTVYAIIYGAIIGIIFKEKCEVLMNEETQEEASEKGHVDIKA